MWPDLKFLIPIPIPRPNSLILIPVPIPVPIGFLDSHSDSDSSSKLSDSGNLGFAFWVEGSCQSKSYTFLSLLCPINQKVSEPALGIILLIQ